MSSSEEKLLNFQLTLAISLLTRIAGERDANQKAFVNIVFGTMEQQISGSYTYTVVLSDKICIIVG